MSKRAALFFCVLAHSVPSTAQQPRPLVPGELVEKEFEGGAADAFVVDVTAGDVVALSVEQRGLDVAVALLDPGGQRILEVDDTRSPRGQEKLAWVAAADGAHRIEIGPPKEGPAAAGAYALRLEAPRAATDVDRARAAAERHLSEGMRLLAEASAESLRRAVESLDAALPTWRAQGESRKEAVTLLGLAQAAVHTGEQARAAERLDQALALSRALGDKPLEAAALDTLGVAQHNRGYMDQAMERHLAALGLWREVGSVIGEAEALSNLASAHTERWDQERAVEAYQQALALYRALGDSKGEGRTLGGLGEVHDKFGDWQKTIEILRDALPLHRRLGDRLYEAIALNSIGNAYGRMGDQERALEYYQSALNLVRETGDRRGESFVVQNTGYALAALGAWDRARASYDRALELRRAVGDERGQAHTLVDMAELHWRTGDRAQALVCVEQALVLARKVGERAIEARALVQLAVLKAEAGDLEGARERCLEAYALSQKVRASRGRTFAAHRLAWVERARGDLPAARKAVEEAVDILESRRTRFSSADFRAAYMASMREVYELHVDVLMQLERRQPGQDFAALAFQAAERARSRSLLDLLAEARADVREGVAPELVGRVRALRNRLNAAAERRLRAHQGTDPEKVAALDREIEELTIELGRTETEIRARSPRYAALTQPSALSHADVQALLTDDTVLLEYFLGEERSFVWALSSDSFSSHELPARKVIEAAARRLHEAVSAPDGQWKNAASELGRMLLGPVADRSRRSRLVVVADGALQYVPFAALIDPGHGEPLVVRQEVVGLPSASTLPLLRQERPGGRTPSKTLMVFADPVFEAADERVRAASRRGPAVKAPEATDGSGAVVASLTRATGDLGLAGPVRRLPFTRREARAITAGLSPSESRVALDFDASQPAVAEPDLERYRFVHFATHGFLNAVHPELSGLLLSLVDAEGRRREGFLTTAAIFNLRLSADLVVLSGCRTALGKEIRGEGLMGMTRGFMYAGAPRVLASLWKVDDEATARLMAALYGQLRDRNGSAAAGLRQAQLSLMKTRRFMPSLLLGRLPAPGRVALSRALRPGVAVDPAASSAVTLELAGRPMAFRSVAPSHRADQLIQRLAG